MRFSTIFLQIYMELNLIFLKQLNFQKLQPIIELHPIEQLSESNDKYTERKLFKFCAEFVHEKLWTHLGKHFLHRHMDYFLENL